MTRLLAEDLYLLCWKEKGTRMDPRCAARAPRALAAALLHDAARHGALAIGDEVHVLDEHPDHPVLRRTVSVIAEGPPTHRAVRTLSAWAGPMLRRHLLHTGALREVRRLLIFRRVELADPTAFAELRGRMAALLTGQRLPADAGEHDAVLAALTEPSGALRMLVPPEQWNSATARARQWLRYRGVRPLYQAIRHIEEAQAQRRQAARSASSSTGAQAGAAGAAAGACASGGAAAGGCGGGGAGMC